MVAKLVRLATGHASDDPALLRFVDDQALERWRSQAMALRGREQRWAWVRLAWHLRQRDTATARDLADRVARDLEADEDPDGRLAARLDLVRGETDWLFARLDLAAAAARSAESAFATAGDHRGVSDACWLRAWIAADSGDLAGRDEALLASVDAARRGGDSLRADFGQAALARSAVFRDLQGAIEQWGARFLDRDSTDDPALAVWVADFRGLVASKSQQIARAAAQLQRMYELALQTGQIHRAINAASNIGFDLTRLQDHPSALEWMQRGLELARAKGWPASLGVSLSETAETLRQMGRLDAAHRLLGEALQVLVPLGRTRWRALVLNYLGDVALDRRDAVSALAQFEGLADLARELDQADLQAIASRGRAQALGRMGLLEEARQAAESALELSARQGDGYNQIASLQVLAQLHQKPGAAQREAALGHLQRALEIAQGIAGYVTPPDLLEAIAREHAARGDHARAYALSMDAIASRERLHGEQATQRALALQIRQETESARAEAEQQRQLADAEARRAAVLQETTRTLEGLGAIGQAITATLSLDAVLDLLVDQFRHLLDADSFGIYLLESDGHHLGSVRLVELDRSLPLDRFSLDDPHRHAARCARERREIDLQCPVESPDPSYVPGSLVTRSALFSPLTVGDRLLGVMTVQSLQAGAYGERERLIFRSLCAYGGIGLANAAAYRQIERAHEDLGQLGQLSAQLQSSPDLETACNCLMRFGEHLFPGSRGAVFLRATDGDDFAWRGGWGGAGDDASPPPGQAVEAAIQPAGLPQQVVTDPAADGTTGISLPMASDGATFGWLQIEFPETAASIDRARHLPLAHALAEQTALALANLRLRDALREQSVRDGLTGTYNRRYLDATFRRELDRLARSGGQLAIAMIDIDHFKSINDGHGHATGDQVLRTVADCIVAAFRSSDIVCRYGGEEFVVLLADAGESVVHERADALRKALAERDFGSISPALGAVTVSAGIACYPAHGKAVEALLGAADAALYEAKRQGRNRVVVATAG